MQAEFDCARYETFASLVRDPASSALRPRGAGEGRAIARGIESRKRTTCMPIGEKRPSSTVRRLLDSVVRFARRKCHLAPEAPAGVRRCPRQPNYRRGICGPDGHLGAPDRAAAGREDADLQMAEGLKVGVGWNTVAIVLAHESVRLLRC